MGCAEWHTVSNMNPSKETFGLATNFQHNLNPELTILRNKILEDNDHVAESPRPLLPDGQELIHPGLHPSLTKVPVTPISHLGEYDSEPHG